jgi:PAS domain S-box-containing protein
MKAVSVESPLGFDPTNVTVIGAHWNDPARLVGITETDGAMSRYVDVSPSVTRILGYTREEILEMHPGDLVVEQQTASSMLEQLARGEAVRRFIGLRHKDGYVVTTAVNAYLRQIGPRKLVISISEPIRLPGLG